MDARRKSINIAGALGWHLPHHRWLFITWTVVLIISVIGALTLNDLRLLLVAPVSLGAYLAITDFRLVYMLMWACVPLSTELEFEGGFGTDFPVEILMIVLTGITLLWCFHRLRDLSLSLLMHPISLMLLLHLGWIALTAFCSTDPFVSLKFLLAKIWYVVPFYVLTYHLLRRERDIRTWFFWVLIPMMVTIVVILVRHGATGFSFETINAVLNPFYRNHVDYALILGVFFPFVFVLRDRWMPKRLGWLLCGLMLVALYLTFTRAAYLGLLVALGGYLLSRWKMVRYAILAACIFVGVLLINLSKDNRYINYAPNYYKTITHYKFSNLLEATYRLEDVSTMERIYRWVAAFYMVQEKPLVGFGPNNFVSFYKPYADEHFLTYVSDNPEQSGVHNYFLMTSVEQGLPGLIIFMSLLFITLLRAEWLYHRLKPGFHRQVLTGVIGSLFFILFALLLNDMVETDKVGSFFFLNLAMVVLLERNAQIDNALKSDPVES